MRGARADQLHSRKARTPRARPTTIARWSSSSNGAGWRPKDDVEVERMRAAAEATRAGFAELVPLIEPGRSERELGVALEAAFLRNGRDFLAFETIVAAGDHAAVLHFAPTARTLRDGELLLVDAGAEFRGYASDVTRTYAVGGAFAPEQALVYETVRHAGEAAIAACQPDV